MKHLRYSIVIGLLMATCSGILTGASDVMSSFIDRYKTAHELRSEEAFSRLVWRDDVDADVEYCVKGIWRQYLEHPIADVSFTNALPDATNILATSSVPSLLRVVYAPTNWIPGDTLALDESWKVFYPVRFTNEQWFLGPFKHGTDGCHQREDEDPVPEHGSALLPRAGEPLSSNDVSIITTCLEHFRHADLSMLELISRDDTPATSRSNIVVASLSDTNMLTFLDNPTLDGAAKEKGQRLSRWLKESLRYRSKQAISVEEIGMYSPNLTIEPDSSLNAWFADDFPQARAYVVVWPPGYERDRRSALFSFMFGPRHHPTQAFYKLKQLDGKWTIEWHCFNYYL